MSSHCPFQKWHDWFLCWTPSSSSLGLLENKFLFAPILIHSISFVFVSVRTSFALRWGAASASEVASTSFLDARSTSMACFVSSRTPARLPQVARCFQMLGTSSSSLGCCGCCCCCCCVCQFLFNVTLGAGLGVASRSKSTRFAFWEVTRSMQSPGTVVLVMIANYFVCQNHNPWSCALDNFIQCTTSWLRFQCVSLRCFLTNNVIKTSGFFFRVLSEWIQCCTEDWLCECASMTFHFLSCVRMVLCVSRELFEADCWKG